MPTEPQSLSQRLAEGRMPVSEALRRALEICHALRRIHEKGCAHGALTPASIILEDSGVHLLPAEAGAREELTAYTAPERLQGEAPDTRTDIFAFGAVLYEMVTGQPAFAGEQSETLTQSIANSTPPATGQSALDRLIFNCLAKDPAERWQRVQQVQMEVKLLAISAQGAESSRALRGQQLEAALRAELRQLEAKTTARLEQQEQVLVEIQRTHAEQGTMLHAASEVLDAVRERLTNIDAQMAAIAERSANSERALEQFTEGARREIADLQVSLSGEVSAIASTVKSHTASMESMRGAMARTDDFIERVVEALESLQAMVLDQSQERAAAVGAM
ncbi:MAG TPA: protein kinase [Bryobacteraceae bacterium]|nr:protein kinase [Bryobacteraceae bacterium]